MRESKKEKIMKKRTFSFLIFTISALNAMEQPQAPAAHSSDTESEELTPQEYLMRLYENGNDPEQNPSATDTNSEQLQHITSRSPATCPECGRNCVTQVGLKRHFKYHDIKRPFKCPYADFAAAKKCHLTEHIRSVHGTEKPYKCTIEGCGFAAKSTQAIRYHIKSKHGTWLQCHYCQQKFPTEVHRKSHEKRHENARTVRCSWPCCTMAFYRSCELARHVRSHMQELPYKCPFETCSYAANEQGHVYQHLKRSHHQQNPQLFAPYLKAGAARIFEPTVLTQDKQTTQSMQPDQRLSIGYLLNPTDEPIEQSQTQSTLTSAW